MEKLRTLACGSTAGRYPHISLSSNFDLRRRGGGNTDHDPGIGTGEIAITAACAPTPGCP